MDEYLIDNNVIANYFSSAFSGKAMNFLAEIIDRIPNISVITKIEALSWRNPEIAKEKVVQAFVDASNLFELSFSVVSKCIEIRRNHRIKTPDAIIAATAIVHDFTLLTSDSDFNRIANLKIINPFNL